jgi:hypothetical protein
MIALTTNASAVLTFIVGSDGTTDVISRLPTAQPTSTDTPSAATISGATPVIRRAILGAP